MRSSVQAAYSISPCILRAV